MPEKNVLEKIKDGELKMRPKYVFVLETIGLAILVGLLIAITIFLISFVLFALAHQPTHRSIGAHLFLSIFPFIPTLVALFIVLLAATVLKKFHVGYAHPFLYLILAVIAISILVSILVHRTSFHHRFSCFERMHNAPSVLNLYQQYNLHELCEKAHGLE